MGLLDTLFEKKGFDIESVLKINNTFLSQKIEKEFNTKVLECGIAKKGSAQYSRLLPYGFNPPSNGIYKGYVLIPVDDSDNIVTNDYYNLSRSLVKIDLSNALDSLKALKFTNTLKQDAAVADFIFSEFQAGKIYRFGVLKIDHKTILPTMVKDVEKIENVCYRVFCYFIDENLETL